MKTDKFKLSNLSDTMKCGYLIGQNVQSGDVICLDGDLGVGKTTLSQAIAKGLEVPDDCYVTSPSFALMHEYPGRIPMYHMDFYRLTGSDEVEELGFEDYIYGSGVTVIEWSRRASDLISQESLLIDLHLNDDLSRIIILSWSPRYAQLIDALSEFIVK